jgi:hypothetical protein
MEGINPGMIRELWPSQGKLPYKKRELPPQISSMIPGVHKTSKCYIFGVTKKMVVYERTHPEIRLVLLLDAPYDREGETWQSIAQSSVERDRGVDPRQSWPREKRLWDEVCRVERRGRPRGTGHPKRRVPGFPLSSEYIDRLRKVGLDDVDLRILFEKQRDKTFEQIGHELSMSGQAVWKRWTNHVEPALKKRNPKFSRGSFKLSSLDSK